MAHRDGIYGSRDFNWGNDMKALFFLLLLFTQQAQAKFQGSISFTEAEKAQHLSQIGLVMDTAASCLQSTIERHQSFYSQWGISPYYGDNSEFGKLSEEGKENYLRNLGLRSSLVSEMQSTSCVGLMISCLGKGFQAAGQDSLWQKVMAFAKANDLDGQSVQAGLRELGWKVLYWNPDTSRNEKVDKWEQSHFPGNPLSIWGRHAQRWATVKNHSTYDDNTVDDATLLVDFNITVPTRFMQVPFFVGTAHGGYHVFPGSFGNVIEGHSTRNIRDAHTIESSPFNPFAEGGGPRGSYFSGLIAIPPGY